MFGKGGLLLTLYDKIDLVPFGEFLPLRWLLKSIGLRQLAHTMGSFESGSTPRPLLQVPGLPLVVPLICYEAIFPGAIVQGPVRPGVIINVTNDGWFGNTTGPRQHVHQARVRAVEEGLPLIRVANNGISAAFDGYGRLLGRLELNQKGVFGRPAACSLADATLRAIWRFAVLYDLVTWGGHSRLGGVASAAHVIMRKPRLVLCAAPKWRLCRRKPLTVC